MDGLDIPRVILDFPVCQGILTILAKLHRKERLPMSKIGADTNRTTVFHNGKVIPMTGERNSPGTEHNISRYQSLMTWTCNGGVTMQWDGVGHLGAGAYADMAIIDRDPLTCSNEDLKKTKVNMTIVGGKPVYSDGTIE